MVTAAALAVASMLPNATAMAAGSTFVARTGSDANPCSASKPCATITHAAAVAGANGTVLVSGGTYKEDVVIKQKLSVIGQGGPVVDASGLDNGFLVTGAAASGSLIQGFTVENATFEGILVVQANNVRIIGNTVMNNDRGMFSPNPTGECMPFGGGPGDCGEGLHLMTSTGSQLIQNTLHDNAGGILLTDEFGPTANNQILQNNVYHNQFDCGITLAGHSPDAVVNGRRRPNVAGVHDNLIASNIVNDNGVLGEGGGVLVAAGGPGSGAWGNRVINNEANGNGLAGVTLHSHAPNQDLNDNVFAGNRVSNDGLTGDPDFSVSGTIGILVASAVVKLTGIQIVGNQISNVHSGIWTMNVPTPPVSLALTNSFFNVQIPVHQQ
jgi:nitrous oxidase accessory protein NosD